MVSVDKPYDHDDAQLKINDIILMKTIEGYTYKVSEFIGKGYSSTVHKGLNDKNGHEVSIKVIEMSKLQDPINQMLLQLEVSALKALTSSKHVLHLYDVYATRNNTYLITQLCEGDLNNMLKTRKNIPYFEAVEIMKQLILGYHEIHKTGYIHRDIKPANIFYKNGVYKYGDFGFAIPIADLASHKNYNVGSPVYMPPEALKENIYSVSCDVWAIGVIFFQLLKGAVPWRAISEKVLYEKIINEPIDSLTVGLPEIARKFIAQILCLDPKERLGPQQLLQWPSQLQSAPIDSTSLLFDYKEKIVNPLCEIHPNFNANNSGPTIKPVGIYFNQVSNLSPHNIENRNNGLKKSKDSSRFQTLPAIGCIQPPPCINVGETEYKQAHFLVNNCIHFIRFLHRVIKFISAPTPLNLCKLQNILIKKMFEEINNLKNLLQYQGQSGGQIKVEGWSQFLKSSKGDAMKKKVSKYQSKYLMFYECPNEAEALSETCVMEAINLVMAHLDWEHNFKPKLVVAADYLTSLYQLLHLHNKYPVTEFVKISKIDIIMEGNPYNASSEHLVKLRKKLQIIRP